MENICIVGSIFHPQIPRTRILKPVEFKNEKTKENARMIFDALENMEHDETYTFDSFLEKIGISESNYICTIQCT